MTLKERQPIVSKNLAIIHSLRKLIYGFLGNEFMTTKELVGCLMSEPYSINPKDLNLITAALEGLNEAGLLRVSFRTNDKDLNIEPLFKATVLGKYRKHISTQSGFFVVKIKEIVTTKSKNALSSKRATSVRE